MHIRTVLGAAMASVIPAAAFAAPIDLAKYTFDTNANSIAAPDVRFTADPFVTGGDGIRSSGSGTFVETYDKISSTTSTQSLASNDYFALTVRPATGYKLSLSSLGFATQVHFNTGITSAIGGTFMVRSSADSYATELVSYTNTTAAGDALTPHTFDLSGISSLQNLTTPVTLRIYLYDNGVSFNNDGMRVDNVILTGTPAVVPEPAAASLVLGAIGMLVRRRRT